MFGGLHVIGAGITKHISMSYPKTSGKPCKSCGNNIYMKRKRDEVKEFCNRMCAAKYLFTTKYEERCKHCGATFDALPSHKRDFCSKTCANKHRAVVYVRYCKRCGKEFVLDNIAYERRGAGSFCSRECGTRIYEFDDAYFEAIDTEDKAYWLGFLLADGNIHRGQMTLKLQRSDRTHLEKIKLALKSEHPIHDGVCDGNLYSVFFIGSKKLCKDLIRLKMTPQKSLTLTMPSIPSNLNRHLIRGYFDGDGCIYAKHDKPNHKRWSIFSGSRKIVASMKRLLHRAGISTHFNQQGKGFNIYTSKRATIRALYQYMYNGSSIWMDRKRRKFSYS